MSILYLIFAEDMKAIHNKDYSVVKTLKAGPARASSFLVPDAGMENNQFHLFQRIEECRLIFEIGHLDIWGDPKWQLFKSLR